MENQNNNQYTLAPLPELAGFTFKRFEGPSDYPAMVATYPKVFQFVTWFLHSMKKRRLAIAAQPQCGKNQAIVGSMAG